MFSLRVTAPDGSSRTHPFDGARCALGRNADNDVVLEGQAVSGHHCLLELTPGGCLLKDRGSSNGTWLNNTRLDEPKQIDEGDRIYIGNHLIELIRIAPAATQQPDFDRPPSLEGPILRDLGPMQRWREQHDRLRRHAMDWDAQGRPARLCLRSREIRLFRQWLRSTPPGHEQEVTPLQREYIEASEQSQSRGQLIRALAAIGGLLLFGGIVSTVVLLWPEGDDTDPMAAATETGTGTEAEPAPDDGPVYAENDSGDPTRAEPEDEGLAIGGPLDHSVIPKETLAEIADRYGVEVDDIVDWNLLNPDAALSEGQALKIERPRKRPLPQQKVTYDVEPGETWTAVADRFGVAITDLKAYNEGVDKISTGTKLTVWIDPKPYKPRDPPLPIPEFHIDKRAVSIGAPNQGRLENGIQLPQSDLYTRRYPNIMWGSSQTIANLQKAIATFRRDVAYDGEVIVADLSQQRGGKFPPHKSHQAGRDIDIWLPTLKGVHKRKMLKDWKRPKPKRADFDDIDWYAVWGLVRALIETGVVENIFLDYSRQKYVYDAAVNMGATKEQLENWIEYPRRGSKGIFRHSEKHYTHVHVRFKCAKWENQCQTGPVRP